MQTAIAQCPAFKLHVHPRERDKHDHSIKTWGYLLLTGARCGGVLSVNEYKSHELADSAARRMIETLNSLRA
jgi:hypothetical protein